MLLAKKIFPNLGVTWEKEPLIILTFVKSNSSIAISILTKTILP